MNINPIVATAFRGVVPDKFLGDIANAPTLAEQVTVRRAFARNDTAAFAAASRNEAAVVSARRPGVRQTTGPHDLEVTIDLQELGKVDIMAECQMLADDDGVGDPTQTGNAMTGRRGKPRRVWTGEIYLTPEQAADLDERLCRVVVDLHDDDVDRAVSEA